MAGQRYHRRQEAGDHRQEVIAEGAETQEKSSTHKSDRKGGHNIISHLLFAAQ